MASVLHPLDNEHPFVGDWGQRTDVRTLVALEAPEEEDPVAPAVAHPTTAPLPRRLPTGRPAGRSQPSAAARRLRAAVAVLAVAAVGTLLGAGALAGAEQAPDPGAPTPADQGRAVDAGLHVVQPGDTLWSLARRLQPEGDVRPLVARLRAGAGGGALVPGQRIRLAV